MSGLSKKVKIIIAAAVSVLILVAGIATGILISSFLCLEPSFQLLRFLTCPVNIAEAHIPGSLCFVLVS